MSYFELFAIAALGLSILAIAAWFADRKLDAPIDQAPRPDNHLTADEYRLLGEVCFDRVAPFFRGRVEHDERLAYALDQTCFAKNEGRDVSASGLPTSKEPNHAGKDQ